MLRHLLSIFQIFSCLPASESSLKLCCSIVNHSWIKFTHVFMFGHFHCLLQSLFICETPCCPMLSRTSMFPLSTSKWFSTQLLCKTLHIALCDFSSFSDSVTWMVLNKMTKNDAYMEENLMLTIDCVILHSH